MSSYRLCRRRHHGETTSQWPIEETARLITRCDTVIATEFSLFVCCSRSYYYLGSNKDRWADDTASKLHFALIMLAVLLTSSAVFAWGEGQVKRRLSQRDGSQCHLP